MGVKFISVQLKATYLGIENKDPSTLYWVAETSELFKGEQLFGTGALASEDTAGLLSPEEYRAFRDILSSGGATSSLTPVDGSLIIQDNTIDIGISAHPGNALVKHQDGLYVGTSTSGNYAAGSGLQLIDGVFSVNLADETHGLQCVDGKMSIALATATSAGAMSSDDKAFLDSLREISESGGYATKDEVQSIRETVEQVQQSYSWEEL